MNQNNEPFDTHEPEALLWRLTTWLSFIEGIKVRVVPYGIEDV